MTAYWSKLVQLVSMAALLVACEKDAPPGPPLAPNAPQDRPVAAEGKSQVEEYQAAIAPYIEQARLTYPAAKKRYLEGLPASHAFFTVTRLRDSSGSQEQVFIAVSTFKDGRIFGRIASDVTGVQGYKQRDAYDFPEAELIDWLISRPDGSEEGNLVGKFLDDQQKSRRAR